MKPVKKYLLKKGTEIMVLSYYQLTAELSETQKAKIRALPCVMDFTPRFGSLHSVIFDKRYDPDEFEAAIHNIICGETDDGDA
jgi:hypothetical protein